METVPVTLSQLQVKRLTMGHTIQLKLHQIDPEITHPHKLILHPETAKRIRAAAKRQRGIRIALTQEEVHGSGLFDWLKQAGSWLKSNIIDTPAYQKVAKPIVRELVNSAVENFVPAGVARDTARKASDFVGEKSGAFGLKQKARTCNIGNYSPLISSEHPANNPSEITLPAPGIRGGSFMAAGASIPKRGRGRPRKN